MAAGIASVRTSADLAQTLVAEFTSGPVRSGLFEQVVLRGVRLDIAASRGWGVQLSRAGADGTPAVRRLTGDQATVAAVQADLDALLAL